MAGFDPDAYLAQKPAAFDPDAYLAAGGKPQAQPKAEPPSRLEKFGMGAADFIHGGAQLLTHMLPQGVVDAGNSANNWLADKTGLVAKLPERNLSSLVTGQPTGVDALVAKREADYQAKRAAAGESGFDGWRVLGGLAPSLVMPAATATSVAGRVLVGAAAGAGNNALSPVTQGNFADEKRKQIVTGALLGGAMPVLGSAVARVISPNASKNPSLNLLRSEGITPTPGQVLGGASKATEEKLSSLPVVGDAIKAAQGRAVDQLNTAVANRALKPVGQKLPAGVSGREAVDYVETALGKSYDKLLPKLTVQADGQFSSDVGQLRAMMRNGSIDPKYAKAFDRYMTTNVLNKFKGQNALTGQTVKDIESDLGQQAARLGQSQDPDARLMADALREAQSNIRDLVRRSNPQAADELKAINAGYANFKRMQKASASVAAEDGVFSPAQLHNAVKAADRSKDKAAFARGDALMQDLSEPAKSVLGNKIPNSGTADRGFMSLAALLDPRAAGLALAAPVLYSQSGQRAMVNLLASRPQAAEPVANALRKASPGLGLLGGQVGLQLGL